MFTFPPCFNAGDTIYFPFDTFDADGASVTITGLAVTDIEVYKNGSVTQRASDNGYALLDTDGIDFDGSAGLHGFSIDTSDNSDSGFWADGSQYWVHVNAITVNSQTVKFTYFLPLGYLLRPTTAGRKLDVSAGGEAGVDWANVGSPTTTVNLSGTTVKTATDVETDTADIQSRLPAALVSGRMDSSVGAMANDVITQAAYDESTAHPLRSADTGSTQVARVGADGDTLETLSDQLDAKASQASVDDIPTNSELATALAAADDAVLAAIAALNNLSQANIRTALGMTSANLDSQLASLLLYGTANWNTISRVLGQGFTVGDTGNDTTHIHLPEHASFSDDEINDRLLVIYDLSTQELHSRWIEDWVGATDLATVATLPFTPTFNDTYYLTSFRRDVTASTLTQQQVRDAMKLSPTAGAPAAGSVDDELDTLLARITSTLFSGITSLVDHVRCLFRSDTNFTGRATALSELNASGTPGDASNTTESLEAIRDRGDAAWTGGGGGGEAPNITTEATNIISEND